MALTSDLHVLGVGVHPVANEYKPVLPAAEIPGSSTREGLSFSSQRQFFWMALDPRIQGDLLREWDAQTQKY